MSDEPPSSPTITVADHLVLEDGSVSLSVSIDTNEGSDVETVVTVSDIDPTWLVDANGGTYDAGTGTWTYTLSSGVTSWTGGPILSPPADSDADMPDLHVTAVNTDTNTYLTAGRSAYFDIVTDAVADTPDLSITVTDDEIDQDTAASVTITTAVSDTDGSETITLIQISNVPTGFTLSAGTEVSSGVWELASADLAGLTITPSSGYAGEVQFDVTITASESNKTDTDSTTTNDTTTATSSFTITWVAPNNDPDAANDTGSTDEDTSVALTVLANDTDVDIGDTLTVTGATLTSGLGSVAIAGDSKSITYDPGTAYTSLAVGDTATVEITYTISDGNGGSDTATVTVTVNGANDAPTDIAISAASVAENAADGTAVGTVTASDPDTGDTHTFALSDDGGGAFAIDSLTGAISVVDGSKLDYETSDSVDITVVATDANGATYAEIITIAVTDITGEDLTGTTESDTLQGDAGANTLIGLDADDQIFGLAGNDTLNGGTGADTMEGGTGDDTYMVDDAGDIVSETGGDGTDIVNASVSFTLGDDLENLTLTGTGNIKGIGNADRNEIAGNAGRNLLSGKAGNDVLLGSGGNDTLDGGKGRDVMKGGNGNDLFLVDNARDKVVGGRGHDTVKSSVKFGLAGDVEDLILTGKANLKGIGNNGNNDITGNRGSNELHGKSGKDVLVGGGGNDRLFGEGGNDLLVGGGGKKDIAFFSGKLGRFDFKAIGHGKVKVIDHGHTNGTDILKGVELVKVGGHLYDLHDLLA